MSMDTLILKGIMLRNFVKTRSEFWYNICAWLTGVDKASEYCSQTLDRIINERKAKLKEQTTDTDDLSDILSLLVEANTLENLLTNDELKSNAFIMS